MLLSTAISLCLYLATGHEQWICKHYWIDENMKSNLSPKEAQKIH